VNLVARLDRWFFGDVPARRVDVVRRLVFGYAAVWLLVRAGYLRDVSSLPERRFEPIGVWAGLGEPLPPVVVTLLWLIAFSGCLATVFGRSKLIGPIAGAAAGLAVITYSNCWGQVFHTENLLVLHLAVLAIGTLLDRGRPELVSGWSLRLMTLTTVVAYVLAGWAKLDIGGLDWVSGDVIRNQVAYDNLRKILLGDVHSPLGGWLAGIGWLWTPVAVATLVIELGAPIVLLGGRWRTLWVVAAWTFHLGILALMAILFPYQLSGVAFASMFAAERLDPIVARLAGPVSWRRASQRRPRSSDPASPGPAATG
jgi:hypothetical protein